MRISSASGDDDDVGFDDIVSLSLSLCPPGPILHKARRPSVPRPPLPVPLLPNSACYSHSCYQNWKFPSLSGVDSFLMYAGFCRRSRYKPRSSLARSADYPFTHPPAHSLLGCRASPSSHPISRSPPSVRLSSLSLSILYTTACLGFSLIRYQCAQKIINA